MKNLFRDDTEMSKRKVIQLINLKKKIYLQPQSKRNKTVLANLLQKSGAFLQAPTLLALQSK